jgi:myo-inositol-1(or 4)-monophosphatase
MELKQLCEEVIEISREVAHWISQQRVTAGEIESKSLNSLVSFVDKGAERMFVERLSALLPEAGFIAEEGTGKPSDGGFNWIIDPLDGTTNYLHGVPIWCTSVALLHNDTLQLGVICDVNLGEVFSAYHGGGARLNGRAMACSTTPALADALLGTGFPYHDFNRQAAYLSLLGEFTQKTRGIRRPGSAALDLAYVACGRFDGFYEYALQPWDVAAGILIVRESGGRVSGFDGLSDPLFGNDLLATNGVLHDPMSETIRRFMHA